MADRERSGILPGAQTASVQGCVFVGGGGGGLAQRGGRAHVGHVIAGRSVPVPESRPNPTPSHPWHFAAAAAAGVL